MSRKIVTRTEDVSTADLKHYPGNARRGDVPMVRESLRVNGQYKPIVVQEGTNVVLAGNHTLIAAREEGWTHIYATFVQVNEHEARKINLVDNRTNDVATYDSQALADLLGELGGDLPGSGFDKDSLNTLLGELGGGFGSSDKDDVVLPIKDEDAVTNPGDLILLGDHRLVCGSALDAADLAAATDNQDVDLVLTDPPYMVDFAADEKADRPALKRRQDGKGVANDHLTGQAADEFVFDAMAALASFLKPGGVFYVFSPPGADQLRFIGALTAAGLPVRQVLIWVKDAFVLGRQDYHWRHEPIFIGWREGAAHHFGGGRDQDTVWEFDRPKRSKEHPTMKPTALLERAIANSSRPGELVLDPFSGSGSTLIAAHAQGRRCAAVELSPGYCDVIVARWERLTGLKAQRP